MERGGQLGLDSLQKEFQVNFVILRKALFTVGLSRQCWS